MHIIRERVSIGATSSSGALTDYTDGAYSGTVYAITRGLATASTEYATGATFTIATRTGGLAVLTAVACTTSVATYYPRANANVAAGGNLSTGSIIGIPLAAEGLTISLSSAAANSSGYFDIFIEGGKG